MRVWSLGLLIQFGVALTPGQAVAQTQDWAALSASAREMSRQVDFLQQVFDNDPRLSQIRGLYQPSIELSGALLDFRSKVRNKVGLEELELSYFGVERSLNTTMGVIQDIRRTDPALQLVAGKLQAANSDLHFALFGGNDAPAKRSQVVYRQILSAKGFSENLQSTVRWVFMDREVLPLWLADLKGVSQALDALQQLQQKKASAEELKQQLVQAEKAWDKVVRRYRDTPEQVRVLLQNGMARVDQVFGRLATLLGVKDRRAPLPDNLSW